MSSSSPASIIAIDQVGYTYAGRNEPTLRNVSLKVAPGSWTVIAGQTGSAKSTLLRALAGWLPRHGRGSMTGRVLLDGTDPRELRASQVARLVGLIQQNIDDQFCTTRVDDEIVFGLENLALPVDQIDTRLQAALSRFGLEPVRSSAPLELSGGQKTRLLLACFWAIGPRVLLLDEPLAQLDPRAAVQLLYELDRLRRDGTTIVVAEHRLDGLLGRADRLVVVDRGQVVADVAANDRTAVAKALAAGRLTVSAEPAASAVGSESTNRGPTLLRTKQLAVHYEGAETLALDGVSFDLAVGDRLAVVGANGSGKSTLLSTLAGLVTAERGTIAWTPPTSERASAANRPLTGMLVQNPDLMLLAGSVADELRFGPQRLGWSMPEVDARMIGAAEAFGLGGLLDDFPLALSQGERLRTALASVVAMQPQVLLLDEPTSGQDPGQVTAMMETLAAAVAARQGIDALLIATHDLHVVARWANRVIVLVEGKIVADGAPATILADRALLAAAQLCPADAPDATAQEPAP